MLYDVQWQAEQPLALGPEQRRSNVRPVRWQLLNSIGKATALKSKGALPLASACLFDLQLLQTRQLLDSQAVVGTRLAIQKAVHTSADPIHCSHSRDFARASVAAALIRVAASEQPQQTCEVAQVDPAEVSSRASRERYGDAFGAASAAGLRLLPQLQQAQRQKRVLGRASHRLRGTAVVSGGLGGTTIIDFQQSSNTCTTRYEHSTCTAARMILTKLSFQGAQILENTLHTTSVGLLCKRECNSTSHSGLTTRHMLQELGHW